MDAIIKIWLDASVIAHDFIDSSYWRSKTDDMRNIYLPSAETHIYESSGKILGFISMIGNFIAAVFVSPESQGQGIGKQLIDFAKARYRIIELAVYIENENSVEFYLKQGFKVVRESIEEHTGHAELIMVYDGIKVPAFIKYET